MHTYAHAYILTTFALATRFARRPTFAASSDLHDAARELNQHTSSFNAPELTATMRTLPNPVPHAASDPPPQRERKNSVKNIVQQFEHQLYLDRKTAPTHPSSAASSHSNFDYSDDDDMDDNQSELSFSIENPPAHTLNPPPHQASGLSLSLNSISSLHALPISFPPPNTTSNPTSRASTPSSVNYAPSSPSSSVNQYISSTEVSPVPFEMLVSEPDPPQIAEPPLLPAQQAFAQPHYKLSAKFESKR